jgi:hypothetical protein
MTTTTALILLGASCVILTALCGYLCLTVSRSSKRDTPTPSTKPEAPISELMTMMTTLMRTSAKETRDLVTTLVLGREQQPQTLQVVTPPTQNGKAIDYDDDSIPLSPAIAATLEREVEETQQNRLLRERSELQEQLRDLTLVWERQEREESQGYSPRHLAEERQDPSPG